MFKKFYDDVEVCFRVSMFNVRCGINGSIGLPKYMVLIAGQHKLLKNLKFCSDLEDKFNGDIGEFSEDRAFIANRLWSFWYLSHLHKAVR